MNHLKATCNNETKTDKSPNRAILLTCYMSGSTEGNNLGSPGYSYDFVARLFTKCFEKRGRVIPVPDPANNLDLVAQQAIDEGYDPVHVSFLPFQDAHLCSKAPNIVVPAWEFPDVPDHEFDGNPRNNWVAMANQCELVVVGGPFTVDSLRRGGVTSPIRVVPVPTPERYFGVADWDADGQHTIDCRVYWPTASSALALKTDVSRKYWLRQARRSFSSSIRFLSKACFGEIKTGQSEFFRKRRVERKLRRQQKRYEQASRKTAQPITLNFPSTDQLNLSGVVYTSVFNPDDGRKNWNDMLTGFLFALKDCPDATLIFKLIVRRPESAEAVIRRYIGCDIPHQCKVGFVVDFLSEDKMLQLAQASTYYLQTTRAEGNCLPLMNFLAAGRPGISPNHSAMSDYFDDEVGFVIESHPEPAAWPQDKRLRSRTSWARMVWPSIQRRISESYELATQDPAGYQALARQARERLFNWAGFAAVEERVNAIFDELDEKSRFDQIDRQPTAIELQTSALKPTIKFRKAA